ncbi:SDR family NAD(P)-dependent oxidoreductase [Fimbriimonas ginsengisoli]|uniref:Short-chain dehydrogenase/reductase SDR n=1 Tax=Fimbriimonas ginsengisoli Gsoil 348 TaxID=661478 RepID=A0A068NU29_FIMGI|nr:SDR family NAD(P)-dependent oxidoreductase [Fimbriimonas ginsengisoli]AIE86285.1 short-chain dehydrogenase/reductase SDR [Fimbriimonas ginsengisoli Gsoil 348]
MANKVALVTGAARGIGRGCALALANEGYDLALGFRDRTKDDGLIAEIEALGRRAMPLQMDVLHKSQIDAAVAEALDGFGQIDVLINNAGGGRIAAALDVTEEMFDWICDANLKGTFFTSQAVGRAMLAQGGGSIVNIGSQAGAVALPTESVYCAAKAAVAHLTKCLAVEWAPHIRVNCVAPTFIRTPGTRPALADADFERHVLDMIPMGRIGEVEDVTGAVTFLCSPAARLITGATLLVDGGWTLR